MLEIQIQYKKWLKSKSLLNRSLTNLIETIDLDYFDFNMEGDFPSLETKLRLGKVVERFLGFALNSSSNFRVLLENFQINKDGITHGEIDFIMENQLNGEQIHLELVHKFYLFRPKSKNINPDDFVGPNLNDSLERKLSKLKNKQFPIINDSYCSKLLLEKGIDSTRLKQKLLFTGSVFVHPNEINQISILNEECIAGHWMGYQDFLNQHSKGDEYYMPPKSNWLSDPELLKDWKNPSFWLALKKEIQNEYSPMVWKRSKGLCSKYFVVWWD